MKSWTPLWSTIVNSSVWNRETKDAKDVKIMWITFLALKDKDGIVHSTLPGMRKDSGLTLEEAAAAINVLESPDSLSNSKEFDGRRIQKIRDGWLVLNHHVYRDMIQTIRRREYNAGKQKEYRLKKKTIKSQPLPVNGEEEVAAQRLAEGDIYS